MDGCPPPRLKRLSNSLGGVWSLCLAGVQESTQPAHCIRFQSASDADGARVSRDAWRNCVANMKSQKKLLLLDVELLPRVSLNVEDLSFPRRAILLFAECITPKVRYHRRHAHTLPSHLVLWCKRQPIGLPWLGGHMVGVQESI